MEMERSQKKHSIELRKASGLGNIVKLSFCLFAWNDSMGMAQAQGTGTLTNNSK